ncbi:inwardly rectifying K+ channel protein, putative [Pediculus humanus corporis]|uniref:Inwardly rectifying K+ channel protein, putative n=1 Tax=Pediculus humanus subsp. corporis TaxID=121224 RepID=E0VC97_PEDHC|nr:inwardly rectifying K+ channel protein, putative [Pediculus humanus corporis]EEB11019.1 inwardly rectifying K+ channel protein, putative [Pediculus humanus corporis]
MWNFDFRYRQSRFSSRRVRKRVVFKHGDVNVIQGNVAKRRRKYLQDIFTTLVDAQWRWTLLVFSLNFLLSWLLFALIWWLIAFSHGDLDPKNNAIVAAYTNETFQNPHWVPCVVGINSFASCFLFSVETQHTIGFGTRSTSEECPEAIFVMCIQSIVGVMIQAFMVGIVFVKLSRPIKRTHTLLFSRNAVICQRDGVLCLMFRVGDMRKSHIIEAHVRAQLIRLNSTENYELRRTSSEVIDVNSVDSRVFSHNARKLINSVTANETRAIQNGEARRICSESSDKDPLIENTKELPDDESKEEPTERLQLLKLNSPLENNKITLNSLTPIKFDTEKKSGFTIGEKLEEIKVVNVPGPESRI